MGHQQAEKEFRHSRGGLPKYGKRRRSGGVGKSIPAMGRGGRQAGE